MLNRPLGSITDTARSCVYVWLAVTIGVGLALFSPLVASDTNQNSKPAATTANAPRVAESVPPQPLLDLGAPPVDWWFAFKFNTKSFPGCAANEKPQCVFGGEVSGKPSGQQFTYASSDDPVMQYGAGCLGDTPVDPVGATFGQIYRGAYHYVIWNDQFYRSPAIKGCADSCGAPWGHSKGVLAWDDAGEGLVMQVTTPSWPSSGSQSLPRSDDGNTLGCIASTNNMLVSQHFFSVRLSRDDVAKVLSALVNASVVTDPANEQIVRNGGPPEIQALVSKLGKKSNSRIVIKVQLSSGVGLLSKPSALHVPPWQLVSAELGGVPLRVASWWTHPAINSTTAKSSVDCWDPSLAAPAAVEIATSGQWDEVKFGLKGGPGPNYNHAKIGVSLAGKGHHFVVFGDMNQQGTLSDTNCGRSQNGRGGMFFIIDNAELAESVTKLLSGGSDGVTDP